MSRPDNRTLILTAAAAAVVVWGYFAFVIGPLGEDIVRLRRELDDGRQRLSQLTQLKEEQQRLSSIMDMARSRQTTLETSLLSNVEGIVGRLELSDKAINMRPIAVTQTVRNATEEKLEIRFVTLGFQDVLQFLDRIESLPSNVRIETLDIRKTGTSATMTMVISTLSFGTGN